VRFAFYVPTFQPNLLGHMKTQLLFVGAFLLSFLTVTISCKKIKKDEAYYKAVSAYISAYSGGSIGRTEPVRIVFAQAANGVAGQSVATGIVGISPNVAGAWQWANDRTLVFTPKAAFAVGEKHTVTLQLSKLFKNVPASAAVFEFDFNVRVPSLELTVEGVQAKTIDDLKVQQITGTIATNEQVDTKQLEQVVTALQSGKTLPILWRHADGGLMHHFVVDEVVRTNGPGKVELQWNAKQIGGVQTGTREIRIPSLDEFSVLEVRVQQGESQSVIVNFSDPILADQDLSGLLRFNGFTSTLRYNIQGNFVTVYPSNPIEGELELIVDAGVKNIAGRRMNEGSRHTVNFDERKPMVRILGKGAILPGEANGDVLLPFEAVGLRAVDVEVFKIFQSNVLQFLQTNDIEGSNELERVGRIVMHKKIALSDLNAQASTNQFERYALNLRDLIAQDPGAVYQVRLGFRRGYTTLPCAEGAAEDGLAHLSQSDEYGNIKSIMGDYRGIYEFDGYGYDDGEGEGGEETETNDNRYNYEDRENPCEKEYYNSQHFAQRNVFVSNIGLMAKVGKDKSVFVVATQLRSAQPLSGASVDVYDYQLQKILSVNTDRNGTARIENLPEKPYIIAAANGSDRGYVRLYDGASLSLSSFDVAGVEPQKGLKGYLYGERGVWRPGDSLFLHFVLEPQHQAIPNDYPLTFELFDASGKLQHRHVTSQSVSGVYPLHCATSASAPTGSWQAKVQVGGATFIEPVRIETVKPNRLKVNVDFGQKAFYAGDNGGTGQLQVNWLHGAPGKNLKARVEMQMRPVTTSFNNYKDYVFDDPTRQISTEPEVVFEGATNDVGQATIPLKIASATAAPGKLSAAFRVRAFEPGGEFSTDNFSVDYYPYDYFIGVMIPKDRWGGRTVDRDKGSDVRMVVVDRQGNPVANRTLQVGMYRLSWQWWWDEGNDHQLAQYNGTTHMGAIHQANLTTDAKGQITYTVKPNDWGRYLIRAIDPLGGHSSGTFFWSGYPSDESSMASRNAAAVLPFSADKEKYFVGDQVTLRIPASEKGRILVSLEDGERVIDHMWHEAKTGDNLVTFKTSADMAPNLYAHVSLFQPHEQTRNDLPIRMYGVIPITVEDQAKHLEPKLAMPDELKPGKPFQVEISEAKGRACTYTLAIVDDGLLDLTRFQTPDAFAAFNQREALGVTTWDIYDHVLGAYATSVDRIMSVGGDAFNTKAKTGAQVNRFKPAILHIGPFRLEKGQKAKHQLQLDNYVGSVRAMLVCSDVGKAYGSTDKTLAVKQPLMIMPTLPRVLGPGETLRLPVEVFAMEKHIKSAGVTVKEANGLVQVLSGAKQVNFSEPGQQMTSFELKAGNRTGKAVFTIAAQGNGESTQQEIEIEVRNPNPIASNVVSSTIEAGQTWTGNLAAGNYTDMDNALIEVSSIPPMHLGKHLDYLIRYPHGCVEQTTSGAFPQLYVDLLTPLSDKQKGKVQKHITAAIEKLRGYQTGGGFAYWPGESAANDWTTSYVGHFMLDAKAKGYTVPEHVISAWKTYQTNAARQWNASNNTMGYGDSEMCQSYRLYTLSLAGAASMADMNRLLETGKLTPGSAALLASAYAQASKSEIGRTILAKFAEGEKRNYDWYGYTYGSTLRDDALLLEAYTLTKDPKAQQYAQKVMRIGDGNWYHTSEVSTTLRALAKYAQSQSGSSGISCDYALNGQAKKSLKTTRFIASEELDNIGNAQTVQVSNTTGGRLYVTVSYSGRPVENNEVATAQKIAATVRYVDAKGVAVDISKLKQGTDFFAEVEIKRNAEGQMRDMALSHVFPSGWEILSSRLSDVQTQAGSGPVRYRDIRDDRVLTYFDLTSSTPATYRVQLNAAYPGRYYLPAVSCEAMYDRNIRTVVPGRWVEVI
jgi:alpha-2-macroglobulin